MRPAKETFLTFWKAALDGSGGLPAKETLSTFWKAALDGSGGLPAEAKIRRLVEPLSLESDYE